VTTRVSRVLMSVALFGGITVVGSVPRAAAAHATLRIAAPAQGRVGEGIPITLTLQGASRVTAYEGFASFDRSVAEFGGLFAGGEDAPQVDVQTVVTDETSGGAPFAVYTCEAAGCPGNRSNKQEGRRQLENLKLRVVPLTPGTLHIRFDDLRFVDKKGRPLDVDVQGADVSVAVEGSTELLAAPPGDEAAALHLADLELTDRRGAQVDGPDDRQVGDPHVVGCRWGREDPDGTPVSGRGCAFVP